MQSYAISFNVLTIGLLFAVEYHATYCSIPEHSVTSDNNQDRPCESAHSVADMQAIRGWWIWAYYINPLAWTTYGLVTSQLGDVQSPITEPDGRQISVADYVRTTWDFKHSHVGWCALVLIGFCIFFRVISTLALQKLHFQSR